MVREGAARGHVAEGMGLGNPAPPASPEFKRNFFLNLPDTTGAKPEKKGLFRKKEEVQEEKSDYVQFSDVTRGDMTKLYDDFVANNHHLFWDSGGRHVLKAQPHAEEIMALLGGAERDLDPVTLAAKIGEALNTPQGWVLGRTLVDHEIAEDAFIIALVSAGELSKKVTNPLNAIPADGQGRISRMKDTLSSRMKGHKAASIAAGGAVGYATGYLGTKLLETEGVQDALIAVLGGIVSTDAKTIVATVAAAGGAFMAARLEAAEEGDESGGFKASQAALDSIKKNPAYAEYIRKKLGVDVNDYKVDATGKITIVDKPKSTASLEDLVSNLSRNIETRKHYFDDLGVPPEARDVMPEQFIIEADPAGYERTGERVNKAIFDRYQALGGGEEGKSTVDNLALYRQARELVMADLTEDLARKIGESPRRSVSTIDQKITDRTAEDGRIIKEKREEAAKAAPELTEMLNGSIKPRVRAIEAYEEAQQSLKEARKALPKYITDTFSAGITTVEEASQAIKEARRGTTPLEVTVEGRHVSIDKIEERKRHARENFNNRSTELLRIHPKEGDETIEQYKERLKPLGEGLKEELQADLAEIKQDEDILTGIENKIKEYQNALKNTEQALDLKGEVMVARHAAVYHRATDREEAFKLIDNAEVQNLLLTGTSSEILKKINELHNTDNNFGWEEADNQEIEQEELLAYAMVLARARKDDGDSINVFRTHANLGTITQEGVTFEQLEALSISELQNLLSDAGLNEAQIGEAQQTVREFSDRMVKATKAVEQDLSRRIRRAERLAEEVDLKDDVAFLEVAKAAMERQGPVFGMTAEVIANVSKYIPEKDGHAQKLSELTDREYASYTQAEADLAGDQPVAYYEFLNILFDYQDKPDREEQFKKISKELTPDALYEILNEVAVDPVKGADLGELLYSLQDNIKKGMVSRRALRKMFEGVIDTLEAEAMAMS